MPRSKPVKLGGKTYPITQLAMRSNKEWREKLGSPVTALISLLQNIGDIKIETAADLVPLINVVKTLALGSMDVLLDALFDYAPILRDDRERIEDESYDDEAIAALGVVISLAYPLDQVLTTFRGLPVMPTSTSSDSPNGDSGTKKRITAAPKTT
jgi:hypothetical protein